MSGLAFWLSTIAEESWLSSSDPKVVHHPICRECWPYIYGVEGFIILLLFLTAVLCRYRAVDHSSLFGPHCRYPHPGGNCRSLTVFVPPYTPVTHQCQVGFVWLSSFHLNVWWFYFLRWFVSPTVFLVSLNYRPIYVDIFILTVRGREVLALRVFFPYHHCYITPRIEN